jgi:hypothetical protein
MRLRKKELPKPDDPVTVPAFVSVGAMTSIFAFPVRLILGAAFDPGMITLIVPLRLRRPNRDLHTHSCGQVDVKWVSRCAHPPRLAAVIQYD